MKRNNILIWISVLFLALGFSACYDDESTYDTNIIPEVVIDTTEYLPVIRCFSTM